MTTGVYDLERRTEELAISEYDALSWQFTAEAERWLRSRLPEGAIIQRLDSLGHSALWNRSIIRVTYLLPCYRVPPIPMKFKPKRVSKKRLRRAFRHKRLTARIARSI